MILSKNPKLPRNFWIIPFNGNQEWRQVPFLVPTIHKVIDYQGKSGVLDVPGVDVMVPLARVTTVVILG